MEVKHRTNTNGLKLVSWYEQTSAWFESKNPVLKAGENGYESDVYTIRNGIKYIRFKKGDGVTKWNDLGYTVIENTMAYVTDLIQEVNLTGQYNGKTAKIFAVNGRRSLFTSTSTFNDVGEGVGASGVALFPELTGSEIIQAISSNANDDGSPVGTGAQTIKVTYIDTNYNIVTTGDITLNGTTAVTVLASGMLFFLFAEVTNVGSNGVSVGAITIRTSAPLTISQITAGGNASLDAAFMIPDGYTGYVFGWSMGNIQNSQDFRLRATVNKHDRSLSTVYHFQDNHNTASNESNNEDLPFLKYPARCKIKVSTISSSVAGTTRADSHFYVLLIQD